MATENVIPKVKKVIQLFKWESKTSWGNFTS